MNQSKDLADKLDALADNYHLPSITDWKQGKFIDQPKYARLDDEWKDEQRRKEETLIRPYGGTNNAIFQVTGSVHDAEIAEYLEAVGRVIKEYLDA